MTNKDLLYSRKNSAQCYVASWMGGEFEGECIYMTESLCCSSETITTLLTGYTSIQNKLKKKKNKSSRSDLLFLLLITDLTLLAAMSVVHSFLPWDFNIWCWLKGLFPFCQQDHWNTKSKLSVASKPHL